MDDARGELKSRSHPKRILLDGSAVLADHLGDLRHLLERVQLLRVPQRLQVGLDPAMGLAAERLQRIRIL